MAVLVEIVMLPFESVDVTGTWTARGVVGIIDVGIGEGLMIMLSDAGDGGSEATGSILVVGCGAAGPSFTGELVLASDAATGGVETIGGLLVVGCGAAGTAEIVGGFTAVVVAAVGTRPGALLRNIGASGASVEGAVLACKEAPAVSGGSTLGVDISAGAAFSDCASGGCVLDADASIEVGTSSGSVDVEVFVRYNAVFIAIAGATQSPVASQFQMPKPGKRFSMRFPASPHDWPPTSM